MAALGRFIMRSGEKALPFFKLMKRTGKFERAPEADKAFAKLKRYLTSPPIMVAPTFREPLLLYIAATPRTISAILIAERDARVIAKEEVDPPSLGVPREVEAEIPSVPQEEPPLQLCRSSRSLRATLLNLTRRKLPRASLRCKSPCTSSARYYATRGSATPCSKSYSTPCSSLQGNYATTSRVTRLRWSLIVPWRPFYAIPMSPGGWQNGLWSFSPSSSFETTKVIKSKALAEFTAEWTDPFADKPPEVESTLPGEEAPGLWVMHFDGAFNLPGAGAGAVLTSPSGDKLFYVV
jgi:hypothetical protein